MYSLGVLLMYNSVGFVGKFNKLNRIQQFWDMPEQDSVLVLVKKLNKIGENGWKCTVFTGSRTWRTPAFR